MGEPAVPPPDLRSKMLEYFSEKSMSTPLNHLIFWNFSIGLFNKSPPPPNVAPSANIKEPLSLLCE